MLQRGSRLEVAVDAAAEAALLAAHERMEGRTEGLVTFRSWTPIGARTKRKRRFTALIVDGSPALVSKMALDREDRKVAGEWIKLTGLSLAGVINHPRAIGQIGDGFIMTYAPGHDLPDALLGLDSQEQFAELLTQAVELVATMHLHGAICDRDPCKRWDAARQYVDQPYATETRFRTALEQAIICPTHGDLAPWNLRYDRATARITIVDWEDYLPLGIAGMDVVNLLITLGLVVFPNYRERGLDWLYDQVLNSNHWYALLVREEINHYASLTNQQPRVVIDLLPFFCQWLIARIENEGRDASSLYYKCFASRYIAQAPTWVEELPNV